MLYLLRPSQTEPITTLDEAAQIVAANIVDHWSLFNIYTIPVGIDLFLGTPVKVGTQNFAPPRISLICICVHTFSSSLIKRHIWTIFE